MLHRILDMAVLTYLTGSALQSSGRLSTPNKMTGDLFLLSLRKVHTPSNESFLEKFKIQRKRYHNYFFAPVVACKNNSSLISLRNTTVIKLVITADLIIHSDCDRPFCLILISTEFYTHPFTQSIGIASLGQKVR